MMKDRWNKEGFYWSCTASDAQNAKYLKFTSSGIDIKSGTRANGMSVRLVKNIGDPYTPDN